MTDQPRAKLKSATPSQVAAAFTAAAALAVAPIAEYEGLRNAAYEDVRGVLTICYGETLGVKVGDWKSTPECQTRLAKRVRDFALAMAKCTYVQVPIVSLMALVSFGYNAGVKAYCTSTLNKLLNAGDLAGACAQLSRWDKAGGIRWKGLTVRRAAERRDCERGLT